MRKSMHQQDERYHIFLAWILDCGILNLCTWWGRCVLGRGFFNLARRGNILVIIIVTWRYTTNLQHMIIITVVSYFGIIVVISRSLLTKPWYRSFQNGLACTHAKVGSCEWQCCWHSTLSDQRIPARYWVNLRAHFSWLDGTDIICPLCNDASAVWNAAGQGWTKKTG